MTFEETVKFCKTWFKDNNVHIPTTSTEWSKGRSGKTVPPGCTYMTLRRSKISVGDLLQALNPQYKNRVKNKRNDFSWLGNLGLEYITKKGVESIEYRCNNCNLVNTTLKGTLRRWEAKGLKYCSTCREASGKTKPTEYYNKFLSKEFKAVSQIDSTLTILHTECGNTFTRSRGYITGVQRSLDSGELYCPHCSMGAKYISGKTSCGKYNSIIEKQIIEHLLAEFPDIQFRTEVMYKEIVPTDRLYRLDVWIPTLNLAIEITSSGNNIPGYQERLKEKLNLLSLHKINTAIITSKSELEDIVRSLLKNKE